MAVVDSSALIHVLVGRPTNPHLVDRLAGEDFLHVPHLIDLELLQTLRGLVHRSEITAEQAAIARSQFDDLALARYPHHPLRDRIWQLRDNLTAYDGAYVALAEAIEAPLVTIDGRLARSSGHGADIELFAP